MAVAAFLYGYAAIALPGSLHSVVLPLLWLALFVLALPLVHPAPGRRRGAARASRSSSGSRSLVAAAAA